MDQRSETRIAVNAEARVEVLGEHTLRLAAEIVDLSSRGMRLRVPEPLPLDAALRIHFEGDLYLGEVTHCVRDGRTFSAGVSLFNVMRNVEAVSQRLNRILQPR